MEFEWDEGKRLKVLAERGVDFNAMTTLFDGRFVYTRKSNYLDEERYITVSFLEDQFFAVVWTKRDINIRIITARRARDGEIRDYYTHHARRGQAPDC